MTLPGLFSDMYTGICLLLQMTAGIFRFGGSEKGYSAYTQGSVDMDTDFLKI